MASRNCVSNGLPCGNLVTAAAMSAASGVPTGDEPVSVHFTDMDALERITREAVREMAVQQKFWTPPPTHELTLIQRYHAMPLYAYVVSIFMHMAFGILLVEPITRAVRFTKRLIKSKCGRPACKQAPLVEQAPLIEQEQEEEEE